MAQSIYETQDIISDNELIKNLLNNNDKLVLRCP